MVSLIPAKSSARRKRTHTDTGAGQEDFRHFFQSKGDKPRPVTDQLGHRRASPLDQAAIIQNCNRPIVEVLFQGIYHRDIAYEIADQRDRFNGEESFSIYQMPKYLRTAFDRLRVTVTAPTPPSQNVTCNALISYGLDTLTKSSFFSLLYQLRYRFNKAKSGDGGATIDELTDYFYEFPLAVTDLSGTGAIQQFNIYLTESIKIHLSKCAETLGLKAAQLAQVCILIALVDQIEVMPAHREYMLSALEIFLRRMRARRRIGDVLITELVEIPDEEVDDDDEESEL